MASIVPHVAGFGSDGRDCRIGDAAKHFGKTLRKTAHDAF